MVRILNRPVGTTSQYVLHRSMKFLCGAQESGIQLIKSPKTIIPTFKMSFGSKKVVCFVMMAVHGAMIVSHSWFFSIIIDVVHILRLSNF